MHFYHCNLALKLACLIASFTSLTESSKLLKTSTQDWTPRMDQLRTTLFTLVISLFICSPLHAESKLSNTGELVDATNVSASNGEADYGSLAITICAFYDSARYLVKSVKHLIMTFMKEKVGIKNPTPADALKFLNLHKNELTCEGKHIINYAFERGKYNEIIDDLFNDEDGIYTDEIHLDFNAITNTKNPETGIVEPMTVLDYIDKVALRARLMAGATNSHREITELRELLVEDFGAVSFTELPLKERQDFEAVKQSK